ncbi:flagellar basal body P-ring biosynthesis protein FlgA [Pelotomaculum sp. FP]|uniref:Flp pilus assembly protein CpaB n=1 Tax=Pelotomaculum sp. FP TaxID=261474 RepID=UPI001066103D|nr:Flp pilus assembly protein CpaB [Pelotomaculum sp. FP]TEB12141.1 flagellar basal body P-ring biosynthesis protein FlgA [Pelotomaculum sp. FP]
MKKIQIIAVLSALIMFICGYLFLSSQGGGNTSSTKGGQIPAVVATQDIAPGTTLTSKMLTVKRIAANEGQTNYYTAVDDAVGSVCISDVSSGEVLTTDRVLKGDNATFGLSALLEKGKRAISIEVDTEQGVANNLKVGNYVDVVFTAQIEAGEINGLTASAGMILSKVCGEKEPANAQVIHENLGQYFSAIALQKIKVVALDDTFHSDRNAAVKDQQYSSVTLEVTPAEAAKIALLKDNKGKIQLVLRPQDDESTVNESRESVLERHSK